MTRERTAAALLASYVLVVLVAGDVDPLPLASSPDGVLHGHIIELLTSALPTGGDTVAPALLLAVAAIGAGRAVGSVRTLMTGVTAHVGATLVVYCGIWCVRAFEPGVMQSALSAPDFGVSVILAAWLALACTRGPWASRLPFALLAYLQTRPDRSLAGLEHAAALVIGVVGGTVHLRHAVSEHPSTGDD